MLRPITAIFILLFFVSSASAQTVDSNRMHDWWQSGLDTNFYHRDTLSILQYFGDPSGSVSNNGALNNLLLDANDGVVIYFPEGSYLFDQPIDIPSHTTWLGDGADKTHFIFDLGGNDHCINITGTWDIDNRRQLGREAARNAKMLLVGGIDAQPKTHYFVWDYDSSLYYDTWAYGSVGEVVRRLNDTSMSHGYQIRQRLRRFAQAGSMVWPFEAVENVRLQCFSIERLDATSSQTSNVYLDKAYNVHISGIESRKCNFAHIDSRYSGQLLIENSYFADAHSFGSGGKAYGVMLQFGTSMARVENCIFETLRHAMVLQAGANGNVFGYNYSEDPVWIGFPLDASADMMLLGNYPYANLFESNTVQNIEVDDTHGLNGPHNVFFRNRALNYGISCDNAPATDSLVFIGNEITNTSFGKGNYNITGNGHQQLSNNVQGNIVPSGNQIILDTTLYLDIAPTNQFTWPIIGYPVAYNQVNIAAEVNHSNQMLSSCEEIEVPNSIDYAYEESIMPYPNPSNGVIHFGLSIASIEVFDLHGRVVHTAKNTESINLTHLSNGVYIYSLNQRTKGRLILKH